MNMHQRMDRAPAQKVVYKSAIWGLKTLKSLPSTKVKSWLVSRVDLSLKQLNPTAQRSLFSAEP